jgi:hypothetical protein
VLQLNCHGNSTLTQVKQDYARSWIDQVTLEDAQRPMPLLEWKFATLEDMCLERQCLKLNLFKWGRLHRCTHGFESKGIDAYLEWTNGVSTKDLWIMLQRLLSWPPIMERDWSLWYGLSLLIGKGVANHLEMNTGCQPSSEHLDHGDQQILDQYWRLDPILALRLSAELPKFLFRSVRIKNLKFWGVTRLTP